MLSLLQLLELQPLGLHRLCQGLTRSLAAILSRARRWPRALLVQLINAAPEGIQHAICGTVCGYTGRSYLTHRLQPFRDSTVQIAHRGAKALPGALFRTQLHKYLIKLRLQALTQYKFVVAPRLVSWVPGRRCLHLTVTGIVCAHNWLQMARYQHLRLVLWQVQLPLLLLLLLPQLLLLLRLLRLTVHWCLSCFLTWTSLHHSLGA
mmetsp:Transcript_126847/g.253605  ORF Transcript_126847/g.253605 Transcript_126847/m.253605 type:complete len:206 (+) Transcript_126847:1111-1728(+)